MSCISCAERKLGEGHSLPMVARGKGVTCQVRILFLDMEADVGVGDLFDRILEGGNGDHYVR